MTGAELLIQLKRMKSVQFSVNEVLEFLDGIPSLAKRGISGTQWQLVNTGNSSDDWEAKLFAKLDRLIDNAVDQCDGQFPNTLDLLRNLREDPKNKDRAMELYISEEIDDKILYLHNEIATLHPAESKLVYYKNSTAVEEAFKDYPNHQSRSTIDRWCQLDGKLSKPWARKEGSMVVIDESHPECLLRRP